MRTQVLIIGGGPSGLLLSQLLSDINIDCLVLEKHTKEHVLSRIRAGVLEEGTIKLLKKAGIYKRVNDEGYSHDGIFLSLKKSIALLICFSLALYFFNKLIKCIFI